MLVIDAVVVHLHERGKAADFKLDGRGRGGELVIVVVSGENGDLPIGGGSERVDVGCFAHAAGEQLI